MATATVDWGDGGAVEQVAVLGTEEEWSFVSEDHTYGAPGTYTVKVTGASGGSDEVEVTVAAA